MTVYTGIDTGEFVYTADQQKADFGQLIDGNYYVDIRQISALMGDGYPTVVKLSDLGIPAGAVSQTPSGPAPAPTPATSVTPKQPGNPVITSQGSGIRLTSADPGQPWTTWNWYRYANSTDADSAAVLVGSTSVNYLDIPSPTVGWYAAELQNTVSGVANLGVRSGKTQYAGSVTSTAPSGTTTDYSVQRIIDCMVLPNSPANWYPAWGPANFNPSQDPNQPGSPPHWGSNQSGDPSTGSAAYVVTKIRQGDPTTSGSGYCLTYLDAVVYNGAPLSDAQNIMPFPWLDFDDSWQQRNTSQNGRINWRNLLLEVLLTDGTWVTVQKVDYSSGVPGSYLDFAAVETEITVAQGAALNNYRFESAGNGVSLGALCQGATDKYVFEGYPIQGYVRTKGYFKANVVGVVVSVEARTILHNPQGVDDRAQMNNMLKIGSDWTIQGVANLGEYLHSRWERVDPDGQWRKYAASDIPQATLRANPPPSALTAPVTSFLKTDTRVEQWLTPDIAFASAPTLGRYTARGVTANYPAIPSHANYSSAGGEDGVLYAGSATVGGKWTLARVLDTLDNTKRAFRHRLGPDENDGASGYQSKFGTQLQQIRMGVPYIMATAFQFDQSMLNSHGWIHLLETYANGTMQNGGAWTGLGPMGVLCDSGGNLLFYTRNSSSNNALNNPIFQANKQITTGKWYWLVFEVLYHNNQNASPTAPYLRVWLAENNGVLTQLFSVANVGMGFDSTDKTMYVKCGLAMRDYPWGAPSQQEVAYGAYSKGLIIARAESGAMALTPALVRNTLAAQAG